MQVIIFKIIISELLKWLIMKVINGIGFFLLIYLTINKNIYKRLRHKKIVKVEPYI